MENDTPTWDAYSYCNFWKLTHQTAYFLGSTKTHIYLTCAPNVILGSRVVNASGTVVIKVWTDVWKVGNGEFCYYHSGDVFIHGAEILTTVWIQIYAKLNSQSRLKHASTRRGVQTATHNQPQKMAATASENSRDTPCTFLTFCSKPTYSFYHCFEKAEKI